MANLSGLAKWIDYTVCSELQEDVSPEFSHREIICKHQLSSVHAAAEYRMPFLNVLASKQCGAMRSTHRARQIQEEMAN